MPLQPISRTPSTPPTDVAILPSDCQPTLIIPSQRCAVATRALRCYSPPAPNITRSVTSPEHSACNSSL
ncbi:hypothetical protein A0H81_14297 [Grifola frondosa]|uniref:Uncharacterized protein n=1 Tax=Grifola frondosa TaxID=5627 RepID=A0A1C7LNG4_GRIFR|nr:hypothetical protein A0H81_14297 [Grifola frondosa]